jgi:GIY-YIG catalytic domain/NUMOD3 motif
MYYVYALIDPRNNMPFYIGKGTGKRAQQHLWDISREHNQYKDNKIAAIRENGMEPFVKYLIENIEDESLAYDLEKSFIKHYGRKGYDENGVLTNVCLDLRPPNHKGKTYEEIYGKDRAILEKQKRIETKIKNNNFGGVKKHNEETRKKISLSLTGKKYGPQSEERKQKIGAANRKYVGKDNKKSNCYKLTNNDNIYMLYGGELKQFCIDNNLSFATFQKNIQDNWPPSKRGKNKGWKIEVIKEKN